MRHGKILSVMIFLICALASAAAYTGIFSGGGPGEYNFTSIHGLNVKIYGRGLYQHMSSDVAIQGIAQDYVTLFAGVPILIASFLLSLKGSLRSKFLFTGILGYFLVTYLFYMCMGAYNYLFLVYASLASLSFYSFIVSLLSFDLNAVETFFTENMPRRFTGGFLIFTSIAIAFLWLGIVVPPLIDGSVYPAGLQHYTTLIVQGMDLSILLPASFLCGLLLIRKHKYGYLLAPVYIVFLSLLMTALTAKIIGMSLTGVNPGPAIIIIPVFNIVSAASALMTLKSIKQAELTSVQTVS